MDMASQETKAVILHAEDKGDKPGTLHYIQFSSSDRLGRGLKAFLLCLVGAGVTLFIPIAHFFLVPGFLVAAFVILWARSRQGVEMLRVEGDCPACGVSTSFPFEPTDSLQKYDYCPVCNESVKITEA